jgi:charged multivesicular body protein 4
LIIVLHYYRDINQVDTTMDDINEQMSLANEISDAISQPVGMGLDLDEDELAAELDQLEQEELDSKLLDAEPVPQTSVGSSASGQKLPSVPKTEPKVAQPPRPSRVQVDDDEDAELAELRASMAM